MVAELVVTTAEPGSLRGCFGTSLESDGRTCAEAATAGNAGTTDATKDDDAERAARTPVNPAQDAGVGLVDLGVETSRRSRVNTHEWKGWSFKMRQYIAAVVKSSCWNS